MKSALVVFFAAAGALALTVGGAACGSSAPKSGFTDGDGGGAGNADGGGGTPSDAGGIFNPNDVQSQQQQVAEVYGESSDTLYKLDPLTKAVTVIGPFAGCTGVIDIALDETSRLFGTTVDGLWQIDKSTAKCTQIASGSYPNSLSFVPKGTVDSQYEALVGYEGGDYVRIDTLSGKVTTIGSIGGGLTSSGDIVSVKNGPTYLTVKGPSCSDCLIEVDPATGALKKNWGSVQHTDVFGLAFWAGTVYGFDNAGELFQVTIANNQLTTQPIAVPHAPAGLSFWGAGSTTSAPVTPTN